MSIHSMTGHGRGEAAFKDAKITIELHSVNHRQFDLRLDLPHFLASLETEARRMIHGKIARGAVACRCHVESGGEIMLQRLIVDHGLTRRYLQAAEKAAQNYALKNDLEASALLNLPGVIKLVPVDAGRKLKRSFNQALRGALKALAAMRRQEGRTLAADIEKRLYRLAGMLDKIKRRLPFIQQRHKNKIRELVAACSDRADKKIIREIVLAAERFDIAEELTRSCSHLKQFHGLLEKGGPVGRTMDFLLQEMVREINTLGSKANDCAISTLVIDYKSELECVREQVQNIE